MKFFAALAKKRNAQRRRRASGVRSRYTYRDRQVEQLENRLLLATLTFDTPTSNGGDGTWTTQSRDGETVVVGPAYLYYNLNPFTVFPGYSQGDALYVQVDYYDEGSGTVRVQYDSTRENFDPTDFHTRSTRIDTQQFVTSHHFLDSTQFANGTNGSDFRIAAFGAPVASVQISSDPFQDSGLEWVWSPPWEQPYSGQSRPVDASTLIGKVLAGYQGWFNTPNDAADEGYVHWGRPGDWSIEQWPDPNDYDSSELFPVPGVTTARGEQAYLFSSANASVVDRHFQWMREHDIDGVFVQRFGESFMRKGPGGTYTGEPQWPVVNARDAAHKAGRTWAIEYDIQNGGSPSQRDRVIQEVKDDWEYLTDPNGLDMLNDSHYQHEDGKPVVAIFGLYVGPTNGYSTAQQQDLIDYFQSRGVYVIGAGRHAEASAQLANAGLHDAYIPWQGYWKGGDSYAPDEATLGGVTTHIPHVFPGFSWTHLQNSSSATSRDREDGNFYWRMLSDAVNETDAPWLFIGMFDEYDEGTNLIPATDDPPVPDTDSQGNSLTYQVSDPRPNDWWLALTGAAKQALQDKTTINDTIPTEAALQNRSNIGGEARWDAGSDDRLSSIATGESQVEVINVPVQGNVSTAIRSTDPYLYFAIDDGFLSAEPNGRDVTIEIEYLDFISGQFSLEYDGLTDPFAASTVAALTGSGEWRTHRFELTDAHFANRQNGGADFRFVAPDGNLLVRRVSVLKESALGVATNLGPVNSERGIQQRDFSGDGQTVATDTGGRSARLLTGASDSLYMYFDVDTAFANEVHAGLNAIVEVTYQDIGGGQLNVQYDSTGPAYANADPVSVGTSGEWQTARFYLDDAFFGGRQNGDADFRLTGTDVPIAEVRVLRPFADLIEPELAVTPPTVDTPNSRVTVDWSFTDDWQTGPADTWTPQEDNRVIVEITGDDGSTWQTIATTFEGASGASLGTYDDTSGGHTWSDTLSIDTAEWVTGTYRLRLTPVDGRDNAGAPVESVDFTVVALPELPGDYNLDGIVNAADYTVWRDTRGTSVAPYTAADGNGDGFISQADDTIWRTNFGSTLPAASFAEASTAPEASTQASPTRSLSLTELLAEATPPKTDNAAESHEPAATPFLAAIDEALAVSNPIAQEALPSTTRSRISSNAATLATERALALLSTDGRLNPSSELLDAASAPNDLGSSEQQEAPNRGSSVADSISVGAAFQ